MANSKKRGLSHKARTLREIVGDNGVSLLKVNSLDKFLMEEYYSNQVTFIFKALDSMPTLKGEDFFVADDIPAPVRMLMRKYNFSLIGRPVEMFDWNALLRDAHVYSVGKCAEMVPWLKVGACSDYPRKPKKAQDIDVDDTTDDVTTLLG